MNATERWQDIEERLAEDDADGRTCECCAGTRFLRDEVQRLKREYMSLHLIAQRDYEDMQALRKRAERVSEEIDELRRQNAELLNDWRDEQRKRKRLESFRDLVVWLSACWAGLEMRGPMSLAPNATINGRPAEGEWMFLRWDDSAREFVDALFPNEEVMAD